ncbi:cytosine permease [Actinacidiphila glaucinigra]|uniref:cytosine permease n=1 Tax=Actinacidiphila glaucinigra TaxID=235986 RepID=UPI0038019ABF
MVYALLAACTATSAVFGYRMLLRLSRALSIGLTVLLVIGVVAYAGDFTTAAPTGTEYLLGGFWPTWLLATVSAALSGPIAFITLLGDYTRYISPRRFSQPRVFRASCAGLVAGLLVPHLFGTRTALAVGAGEDYAGPLVAAAPAWYLVPLLVNASAGSGGQRGADALQHVPGTWTRSCRERRARRRPTWSPRSPRCWSTSGTSPGPHRTLTSFVPLLTAVGTPWAVITLIGFARVRGRCDADALQVCNRRARGGLYWYHGGGNVRAAVA